MNAYREQVTDAVGAVAIRGPLRYAWLGRLSRPIPAGQREVLDAEAARTLLLGWLREELYASFFTRGRAVTAQWRAPLPQDPDAALVREIVAANTGRGGRQSGWTIARIDGAEAVVTADGIRARLAAADCRAQADGTVSVPRPALTAPAPGFLKIFGDADLEPADGLLRVYWHVSRSGAPALIHELTAELNARAMPFRLKVADHPLRFDRCDAAVLYLAPAGFVELRAWLTSLAAALASRLRPPVPAFTLALAPGVGAAEHHALEESFGGSRCALLADGILAAHDRRSPAVEAVLARFARAGVDIDAPYREPAWTGCHVL